MRRGDLVDAERDLEHAERMLGTAEETRDPQDPREGGFERRADRARDLFETALALAKLRKLQHRFVEAERSARSAWTRNPASAPAAAILARLLGLHLDRREDAFVVLHKTLELNDSDDHAPALHVVRGELLLEDDAIAEARVAFARAVDTEETALAAKLGLARTFNAEGLALSNAGAISAHAAREAHDIEDESSRQAAERAIFALKRAADLDPEWSAPLVNLGVVFSRLGKHPRAIEAFRSALKRDPRNAIALFNLATALHAQGDLSAAAESFEALMALDASYPRARICLANVYGDLQLFDKAVAMLLDELDVNAGSVEAWSSLGLAYACSGNLERGESCLQRALALDPTHFNAYHNLAVLYATSGRKEAAARVLQDAYRIDPLRAREVLSGDKMLDGLSMAPSND
jgi:tetratricopeptide (TPR) repeat protein